MRDPFKEANLASLEQKEHMAATIPNSELIRWFHLSLLMYFILIHFFPCSFTLISDKSWTSKLTGRNTHLTSHWFLHLDPRGPIVCDVAIECGHFSPQDGFINNRKNARTKKKINLDLRNLNTSYSVSYAMPPSNLFLKRLKHRRCTGEQSFDIGITFKTACASLLKCMFLFCTCCRVLLLVIY